ncbi:PepSY domain-containing protein [Staphylococcus sp. ACRSN]|uniref:PepSY domain-containing protein n=1 Tax=Staphylococcus sp. ACRSN TaxID=2918214 RepID=UPI001EF33D67|nr:PepSY domain-containing protein [Staphylococcus sp. ACRSN]MCG7337957.1 PepSY domain-containing protein [Staphylococcus sp. ACRSN]
MKQKYISVLILTSAMLLGCSNDDSGEKSSENNKKADDRVITLNQISTSPEDAIKKSRKVYTDQDLKGLAYERENGKWCYKVEQQKNGEESEVIIADKQGKVIHRESEKENDIHKNELFNYGDAIDYKKAIKKSQKEFNGKIKEWSLSKDEGKLIYDINLEKGKKAHEITVDAKSGKILQNEKDD